MPVVLHSPTRSNAVPTAPAIRLHPSTAGDPNGNPARPRGARFADDYSDGHDDDGHHGGRATNNVTFQTRPRGYTADSTNSEGGPAYPTFAAYRQAQHGNLEAFGQRIKRAFATSQQQQLEQQQFEQHQREHEAQLAALAAAGGGNAEIHMQSLSPGPAHNIGGQFDQNGSTRSLVGSSQQESTTRPRSASAANIIGDFAERIKNGTLFSRSQTSILPTPSATDPNAQQPQTRNRSGTGSSISEAGFGGTGAGSVEVMLASDGDEQLLQQQQQKRIPSLHDLPVQQGDVPYQQTESKKTDQGPRGNHEVEGDESAMSLATAVRTTDEEKVEPEKDPRPSIRQGPKRQDSEDTVVVTMDGIRRPSVNGVQPRTNN